MKAIVSQDIISVVQNASVVDTSDLQTKLERTKERFENCILKKETKYAKLWNDWYKKCDECKYDKISYDKAYKDMQQNIERLQAQFRDVKGKSTDTATYKNLFDSISVSRVQTKTKIASLQNELQCNICKNAKLRTQLCKKVSDQKDNTQDSSKNTKFAKQPNVEILPKIGETNALSKPVTSNSVSTPQVSKGLDNTKTRRPQPRSNTKNDRVPSASKRSQSQNKEAEVEEHHRNLLLSKNNEHMSSACNNFKLDSQDVISKVFCVVCKKCLNSVNHDVCLNNYVNGKKSTQQKNQPEIKKPKKVGFIKRLATPKPKIYRLLLRWSPTGRLFDQDGKLVASSKSESQVDCSNGDNACTSNAMEPKNKRFPNSTSLLGRLSKFVCGASTQVVPRT
nr:hypothetical protein [Tanacetum cinerariifolium]